MRARERERERDLVGKNLVYIHSYCYFGVVLCLYQFVIIGEERERFHVENVKRKNDSKEVEDF